MNNESNNEFGLSKVIFKIKKFKVRAWVIILLIVILAGAVYTLYPRTYYDTAYIKQYDRQGINIKYYQYFGGMVRIVSFQKGHDRYYKDIYYINKNDVILYKSKPLSQAASERYEEKLRKQLYGK